MPYTTASCVQHLGAPMWSMACWEQTGLVTRTLRLPRDQTSLATDHCRSRQTAPGGACEAAGSLGADSPAPRSWVASMLRAPVRLALNVMGVLLVLGPALLGPAVAVASLRSVLGPSSKSSGMGGGAESGRSSSACKSDISLLKGLPRLLGSGSCQVADLLATGGSSITWQRAGASVEVWRWGRRRVRQVCICMQEQR